MTWSFSRKSLKRPFLYIAAMPRSGSTMLAGMLSKPPLTHVFSELGLNRGLAHGFDQLERFGEEFPRLLSSHVGNPHKMLQVFGQKIIPKLASLFEQIGIKECFHDNWQWYEELPGELRIIVLARDPRDIMLSVLEYGDQVQWHRQMWSDKGDEYIATRHNEIWAQQKEMLQRAHAFPLRYEDLCQKPEIFARLCRFCDLPLDAPAAINGAFDIYPWRNWEVQRHGGNLSLQSVFRWKYENDSKRRERAHNVGQMMSDYCRFWGYDP